MLGEEDIPNNLIIDSEEYAYQLVEFCERQKKGVRDIDVVPTSWVKWDVVKDVCILQYPGPPYNARVCKQLQRLVQENKSPLVQWPWWDVEIKGGADDYEMAIARLNKLKTMAYAYTTDTEESMATKAVEAKEKIRKKPTTELFNAIYTYDIDDDWTEKFPVADSNKLDVLCAPETANTKKIHEKRTEKLHGSQILKSHPKLVGRNEDTSVRGKNEAEKNLSPDTIFLLKILKKIAVDVQANTAAINALHDSLRENSVVNCEQRRIEQIEEKYHLELPLHDLQAFHDFDKKLSQNEELSQHLSISFQQLFDRNNNATKSVTNILRKFVSREIAINFTAKKKIEGKTVLKDTRFGQCMKAALIKYHTLRDGTPINENEIVKSMGYAISNAKDWDGRKRVQKSP